MSETPADQTTPERAPRAARTAPGATAAPSVAVDLGSARSWTFKPAEGYSSVRVHLSGVEDGEDGVEGGSVALTGTYTTKNMAIANQLRQVASLVEVSND